MHKEVSLTRLYSRTPSCRHSTKMPLNSLGASFPGRNLCEDSLSWKNSMSRGILPRQQILAKVSRCINEASDKLATYPLQVLTSIISLAHESTTSSVLWVRPQNKVENWADFDTYVPDATKIAEAVREALLWIIFVVLIKRRYAVELVCRCITSCTS